MSLRFRIVGLFVIVAAIAAFGLFVAEPGKGSTDKKGDPVPEPGRMQFTSSTQCAACHRAVFDEWHGSHHQIAYLNEEVRALSDDFRNKACQACHLPRPVAITGYAKRTLHRTSLPDEGVSCLTCHLGAGGEILGRQSRPDVPCKPIGNEAFTSVSMCESCHNQHWTTDQWRASHYPKSGQDCNACHMPEVRRRTGRFGRGHGFRAAHDLPSLRRAVTMQARVEADELVVRIENIGAGHNFPTEERSRAADVVVQFGEAGEWQQLHRFRLPYRSEPLPDTTLPAGASKELRIAVPESAQRATVRFWYRLTPFVTDADRRSVILFEQELSRGDQGFVAGAVVAPEPPADTAFVTRPGSTPSLVQAAKTAKQDLQAAQAAAPVVTVKLESRLAQFQAMTVAAKAPVEEPKRKELRELVEMAFLDGFVSPQMAARAKRSLKSEEHAFLGLEDSLRHEDPKVRMHAAFELGQLGRQESVLPLLLALKDEVDGGEAEPVVWIVDALAQLGNHSGLPNLIALFDVESSRALAGERGIAICRAAGVELVEQPSWEQLRAALRGLQASWQVKPSGAEPGAMLRGRIAVHLVALEDFQLRGVDEARYVLSRLRDLPVPLLRQAVGASEPYLRTHALEILRAIGAAAKAASPEVVRLVDDPLTQVDAVHTLGRIGAADAVPRLVPLLDAASTELRAAAAEALGELRAKSALPRLRQVLDDEEQPMDVRVAAAFAVGRLEPEGPGVKFLERLRTKGAYHAPTLTELLERLGR